MILYIIRHGETEWNKMGKMQGRTDISLSEDGRKLAQKTADGLKNVKFDYNSSYKDKIKKGILQITNNGTVRLSSNSKENIDKINTLEKILGRKHVTLKAYDTEEGAYVKYELNNLTKKTWKKVINDYKKILEMY